jgi:hypothetical protein
MTDTTRTTIEIYPDYIKTILIALRQKAEWHAAQGDKATHDYFVSLLVARNSNNGDDAIVAWINQIIVDIEGQQAG